MREDDAAQFGRYTVRQPQQQGEQHRCARKEVKYLCRVALRPPEAISSLITMCANLNGGERAAEVLNPGHADGGANESLTTCVHCR